jgi:DNA helicase-2/ATP-dependent DNA helicase PcrA
MAINLDGLNPEQKEAVLHGAGPLLILAGAGSGKTRVLTHRIAHLVDQGVSPWRILAITFTNKAAAEMRERVEHLVGPGAKDIWVSTFHSACVRMLRRDIQKLGYAKNFVILDSSDQQSVIKECLKQLNLSDKQFQPGAVQGSISAAKNGMVDAREYAARAKDYWQQQVAQVYKLYQERLKANNALDFDDLLMLCVRLFEQFPEVLEHYQGKFEHILVDEYQDTNHVQNRWVFLLAAKKRNLCVVGDDDQGIYSWRGADIQNILEFEAQYPRRPRGQAGAELPLHGQHPGGGLRGREAEHRAQGEEALDRKRPGRSDPALRCHGRER